MDLDDGGVNGQTVLFVGKEVLDGVSLVSLELDHITGFLVGHDGAIARELLLDDLEDLLQVKFGWNASDRSEGLPAVALLKPYMDVVLVLALLGLPGILILSIREGIETLEVLDVGHTILCTCCAVSARRFWSSMGIKDLFCARVRARVEIWC